MAKPRSVVVDYLVYVLARVGTCILQMLSFRAAGKVAQGLAWLAYHLDRRHRLVADENLRHAFPGRYTDRQREQLIRRVYLHFSTVLIEILQLPRRLQTGNWKKLIDTSRVKVFVEHLLSGRPLLVVSGHFGNWEVGGCCLAMLGFTSHGIARPLDNPFLDRFLRSFRERTGQKILAKRGDFARIMEILAGGGILGTLADQDAGPRGLFVEFFGRPASTHKAVALLALQNSVPMVVVAAPSVNGKYQVKVADLILPEEYQGRPNAVQEITQRFTADLEAMVRENPEQYFWLHRRWKHQPQAKKSRKAA